MEYKNIINIKIKGIRLEDVTPELDSKAYAELKNNKH